MLVVLLLSVAALALLILVFTFFFFYIPSSNSFHVTLPTLPITISVDSSAVRNGGLP